MRLDEGALEAVLEVSLRCLVLVASEVTATDEVLGVERANRALLLDQRVHERLRHRGVVALVVSASAVREQVDDDVAVELLAVCERELCDAHDRFGVIAVHVQDRSIDRLGDVGRVGRRAAVARRRGEADLVVDHEVHGSACAVCAQLRHLQGLEDDALACHSGVTVHEDRQDGELAVADAVLACAHHALEHAVDGLEV